jgi:hypothetical protein
MSTTDHKTTTAARAADSDLMDRIDTVTADTEPADIDPDSIEARLRLVLPGHTFFTKESALPEPIQQLLKSVGGELVGGQEIPDVLGVIWSTPTGMWRVKTRECPHHSGSYRVNIDGPDTELERGDLSIDQVLDLLGAVGAIKVA